MVNTTDRSAKWWKEYRESERRGGEKMCEFESVVVSQIKEFVPTSLITFFVNLRTMEVLEPASCVFSPPLLDMTRVTCYTTVLCYTDK